MELPANVGGTDRALRIGLAVLAVAVAVGALAGNRPVVAAGAGLAAVGLGFNAVTCFCGLNAALGLDTTRE